MELNGAEALVAMLQTHGVQHVFGLPGSNFEFYEAMRRRNLAHVLVRHEHAAAHMADGYARASHGVGVCDGSAGPGAINLATGIATAYADGMAVIAVLGSRPTTAKGRGQFQEIDQVSVFKPITKEVIEVDSAARVPELVRRAFRVATTGKPGPVAIDLPQNVAAQVATFAPSAFDADHRFATVPALRIAPPGHDVEKALDMLAGALRPVIWCGGGVLNSNASAEVTALAEQLGIPVATTYMGKGSLPENHPLCLGPAGATGRPGANAFVKRADLVLVLGSRMTDVDTAGWTVPAGGVRLIQVDIDSAELGKNYAAEHVVLADILAFCRALRMLCTDRGWRHPAGAALREEAEGMRGIWAGRYGRDGELRRGEPASPVHPLKVIDAMRAVMRPDDVLVCDSGLNQVFGAKFFEVQAAGRSYMGPRGMGTMGFGFPAALGAKAARPQQRFVALCGDGGFAMVLQELETSRRANLPVTVVVLNNSNLEYIRHGQKTRGLGGISTDYTDTRFAEIAQAYGCRGVRLETLERIESCLAAALASPVTTVVEVITPMEASPFEDG